MLRRFARFLSPSTSTAAPTRGTVVESLEKRQLMAVSAAFPIAAKIKVKNLFDANGLSTNQSTLTVRFSDNITLADASKVRMIGYVINPVGGAQRKVTVALSNITSTTANTITFTTDSLSPKSGRIIIDQGGVKDSKGDDIVANVQPPKGQNKERFTLTRRPFRPTDVTIFPPSIEPSGSAGTNATSDVAENTVTSALNSFLNKKVDGGLITAAQRTQALGIYNNNTYKVIVPNANLRAAIASLVGTVGEPAIDALLTGENDTGQPVTVIDFSPEAPSDSIVAVSRLNAQGRRRVLFKEIHRGEPFQVLSARIAHESLHQGPNNGIGIPEEQFANTVETLVYAQQVLGQRGFIFTQTPLVKSQNAKLLAMLNSGSAVFPRVGVSGAVLSNSPKAVFWRSTTYKEASFQAYITRIYDDLGTDNFTTPGHATLTKVYKLITGRSDTVQFDANLMKNVDSSQQIITDKNAIKLAGLLGATNWVA